LALRYGRGFFHVRKGVGCISLLMGGDCGVLGQLPVENVCGNNVEWFIVSAGIVMNDWYCTYMLCGVAEKFLFFAWYLLLSFVCVIGVWFGRLLLGWYEVSGCEPQHC
jgi:hypothetical protein